MKNNEPLKDAKWIWGSPQADAPNEYFYFRKTWSLASVPGSALLHCCADMRYRLWVNGALMGEGPAKYHISEPAYDTYDIAGCIRAGRNVAAFLVHGMGSERCSCCMGVRNALIASTEWDGGGFVSDSSWKALKASAYRPGTPRINSHQAFVECFDAGLAESAWETPDYDDSEWGAAVELGQAALPPWERLVPRSVPLLSGPELVPHRIVESGLSKAPPGFDVNDMRSHAEMLQRSERSAGEPTVWGCAGVDLNPPGDPDCGAYVVFDFGDIWPGHPCVEVEGEPGTMVDLGYGETLSRSGRVDTFIHEMRYADRIILGRGKLRHVILMPKSMRYLLVEARRGRARVARVSHRVAVCPAARRGRFACSDPSLGRAWEVAAHTAQICMEDVFIDTPWRERSGWLMDNLVSMRAAYHAFGGTLLARRSLALFMKSTEADGNILVKYPSGHSTRIPTWTMGYAPAVAEYTRYSGDLSLAQELWPGFEGINAYFERHRGGDDLLSGFPQSPGRDYVLLDWAPIEMRGAITGLNALYVYCLEETAWLADRIGEKGRAAELRALAVRTGAAIRTRCWDAGRKVFVNCLHDGKPSKRFGQHENFLALLFKIADAGQAAAINSRFLPDDAPLPVWPGKGTIGWFELARGDAPWEDENEPVPAGTPFFSYFIVRALFEAGRAEAALNYIRGHWGGLLSRGATTTWEGWSDLSSLSHAWSAAPASLLSEYVLGVVPLAPGFDCVGVYPCPGGLSSASGRVPTPRGAVEAEWGDDSGAMELRIRAPAGMGVEAGLPVAWGKEARIFVNGRELDPAGERIIRSCSMRVASMRPEFTR